MVCGHRADAEINLLTQDGALTLNAVEAMGEIKSKQIAGIHHRG